MGRGDIRVNYRDYMARPRHRDVGEGIDDTAMLYIRSVGRIANLPKRARLLDCREEQSKTIVGESECRSAVFSASTPLTRAPRCHL